MPDPVSGPARGSTPADHGSFEGKWLALREPVDRRSRSRALLPPLAGWLEERPCGHVVDLAAGSGSNLRYLAPRLPGRRDWVLVDRDRKLLDRAMESAPPPDAGAIRALRVDLAREPDRLGWPGAALVTASAFLDLVSREWISRLVDACRSHGAAVLVALTYSGGISWTVPGRPGRDPDPLDRRIREAVNAHQAREKGFGVALGPDAAPVAAELFEASGYRVRLEESPWILGSEDVELVLRLVDGWARAATEARPELKAAARGWAEERRRMVLDGSFEVEVSHLDLLALPS